MTVVSSFSNLEVEVIKLIISCPGTSSAFLQEALDLDQPHVSRVLKRLSFKGCIRRVKFDCRGKRFIYRYYISARNGITSTYPLVDLEIDNILAFSTNRHSSFYRLLAAFFDLDNQTLSVLLRFLQDLYSARMNSSLPFSLPVSTDLRSPSTANNLLRRNRLSAFCFHYFSRARAE